MEKSHFYTHSEVEEWNDAWFIRQIWHETSEWNQWAYNADVDTRSFYMATHAQKNRLPSSHHDFYLRIKLLNSKWLVINLQRKGETTMKIGNEMTINHHVARLALDQSRGVQSRASGPNRAKVLWFRVIPLKKGAHRHSPRYGMQLWC